MNRIHNEVTDLFKVKPEHLDGNELKEDIMEKMLVSITDLPLDTMATVCPVTDNIEILHHTTKLGGDILNKEVIYFSLTGKGKTAVPVIYKPKSILKLAEVQCPTWTQLNAVKDEKELDEAPVGRTKTRFTSCISISPIFAAAIMELEEPSPGKAYLKVMEVASQETSNPENSLGSEPATTSLKVLLPFLWAAKKELIHPVAKLCSFDPKVKAKVEELHNMLHKEPTARPTQTNEDSTLARVSQSLDRIVERNLMNGSASEPTQNKKSFEGRLSTIAKTLILTASAPDSSSVLTEPSETSKEFFEQKNAAEAKRFLYHHLIVIQNYLYTSKPASRRHCIRGTSSGIP